MNFLKKAKEHNESIESQMAELVPQLEKLANAEGVATHKEAFKYVAAHMLTQYEIAKEALTGKLLTMTYEEGKALNEKICGPIYEENYETSYFNPAFAVKKEGKELGGIISNILRICYMCNPEIMQGDYSKLYFTAVLLVKVADALNASKSEEDCVAIYKQCCKDGISLFECDHFKKLGDNDYDFDKTICMESDLNDFAYIYRYGCVIRENEEKYAKFILKMTEEEVKQTAITITEGMKRAFVLKNTDIKNKKSIRAICPIGYERIMREIVGILEGEGYHVAIRVETLSSNKQFSFDYRDLEASYIDEECVSLFEKAIKEAMESNQENLGQMITTLYIDGFGEAPFSPEMKPERPHFDDETTPFYLEKTGIFQEYYVKYIDVEHQAFTIIAYPIPEIGDKFEEIYAETVKINNLDYEKYAKIQQSMIDLLDTVEYVHILGGNGNKTDLMVHTFGKLEDPAHQSKYCNCLADLNIPVGEVFTSPVLKGTTGKLHVTQVYLEGLNYLNLEIDFVDGMVTNYTCTNFESEEENKKYIKDNILNHFDSLPLGEFAIGTNTYAYRVGKLYDIQAILPILIAEKTGPHFAVGDTCYSHQEDVVMKNCDGKEVVEKANELTNSSATEKKYFQSHTDITIPYNELKLIAAVKEDGSEVSIIEDGKFVLPGTESLNEALEGLE